ncbi:hypothetical protein K488DRAFT_16501, partial [Vararia minispora EC-137]
MGQRHQAFAIAKIVPYGHTKARYRCIAAWHHQWCYGRLPLHAVSRFVRLLKRRDNGDLVRFEIAAMHGLYALRDQDEEGAQKTPDVPCTYTAALLGQAWDFDLEMEGMCFNAYTSGVSFENNVLAATMGSGDGGK